MKIIYVNLCLILATMSYHVSLQMRQKILFLKILTSIEHLLAKLTWCTKDVRIALGTDYKFTLEQSPLNSHWLFWWHLVLIPIHSMAIALWLWQNCAFTVSVWPFYILNFLKRKSIGTSETKALINNILYILPSPHNSESWRRALERFSSIV